MSCSRSTASTESAAICLRASRCRWVAACPAREDTAVAPRAPFQPITRLWQLERLSAKHGPLFERCPPKAKVTRSIVSGASTTLMRDLDCLPTIKSKVHHRHTKKTLTTQAHEGGPRSPSMRFARDDEIGGRRRQLCNVIRLIGSNRGRATISNCYSKSRLEQPLNVGTNGIQLGNRQISALFSKAVPT